MSGPAPTQGAPKPLITPIFHDFYRFFPVFPWTSGRVLWIPGVQTLKMGEKWGKMGKKWVKNEITGLQKTALMHASAHLAPCRPSLVVLLWRLDRTLLIDHQRRRRGSVAMCAAWCWR